MPVSFDLNTLILTLVLLGFIALVIVGAGFLILAIIRSRGREERSIDSVLLQIAVPRGNEIKIDAMEQLFRSLYSIKKGGWQQKYMSTQPAVSFEIVGRKEDIRFYVWTPK